MIDPNFDPMSTLENHSYLIDELVKAVNQNAQTIEALARSNQQISRAFQNHIKTIDLMHQRIQQLDDEIKHATKNNSK